MDLIGLLLFSVSMAIFGAYQSIPFTNIRPNVEFSERLQSGYKIGFTFGTIGDLLDLVIPRGGPAPPSPTATVTPSITSRSIFHPPTCPVTSMALASVATKPTSYAATPVVTVTSTVHTTIVVTSLVEVHKGPKVRGLPDWLLGIIDMALLLAEELSRISELITMPHINVHLFLQIFVFSVYGGALLVTLGAAFFIIICAYSVCRHENLDFARRIKVAKGDIDAIFAEIKREKALIMTKLRGRGQEIPKDMAEIASLVKKEKKGLLDRAQAQRTQFDLFELSLAGERNQLLNLSRSLHAQFTPFPTRETLLGDINKKFKDSLDGVKAELEEEVAKIRSLIPEFMEKFDSTIASLQKNRINNLPELLEDEKQKLQREIDATRRIREQLPDLTMLRDQAYEADSMVSSVGAEIREITERSKKSFEKVYELERVNQALQRRLAFLENELAFSRLALKSAEESEPEESGTICVITDDNSTPDVTNDLLEELLGKDDACEDTKPSDLPEQPRSGSPGPYSSCESDVQTAILAANDDAQNYDDKGESKNGSDDEVSSSGLPVELERNLLMEASGDEEESEIDYDGVMMAPPIEFGSSRGRRLLPRSPPRSPRYIQS